MAKEQSDDQGKDFKLERYKFILQSINSLNENVHRYLALYQTLASTIIGAGILLFVNWKNFGLSVEVVKAGIHALVGMLIILSFFVVIQIIAGFFSWLDYRHEEVKLLDEVVHKGYRSPTKIKNFWRWSETYFVIFILVVAFFVSIYAEINIVSLIK